MPVNTVILPKSIDDKSDPAALLRSVIDFDSNPTSPKIRTDASFTGTLEVNLDAANDEVSVYGTDGSTLRQLRTDAIGRLEVISSASGITDVTTTNVSIPPATWVIIPIVAGVEVVSFRCRDFTKNMYYLWDTSLPSGLTNYVTMSPGLIEVVNISNPAKNLYVYNPNAGTEIMEVQVYQ